MKILLVGDLHFRAVLPYSGLIEDRRRSEWESIKDKIISESKQSDLVVLLGDVFDLKNPPAWVIAELIEFLKKFGDKKLLILRGNHDGTSGETSSIDFLRNLDYHNWMTITSPQVVEVEGLKILALPFCTMASLKTASLSEAQVRVDEIIKDSGKCDLLVHHHAMMGSKLHGNTVTFEHEVSLNADKLLDQFGYIVGGHIHDKQLINPRALVTGCVPTQEVGEESKSIHMLDTELGIFNEIKLPCRGIYNVNVFNSDFSSLVDIPDNSIVKATVRSDDVNIQELSSHLDRFDGKIIVSKINSTRESLSGDTVASELSFNIKDLIGKFAEAKGLDGKELIQAYESI